MRFCYSCMRQIADNTKDICPYCKEKLNIEYNADMCLKPGTVLQGKFIVGKLLGSGGFGNTYIGWNNLLQCKVAIKEYFPKQLSGRERTTGTVSVISESVRHERFKIGLRHFLEEARSIANLQDVKGVVQVYSFFEENNTGYIVMEFLEGMDVKHILKLKGNRVEYDWARRVVLTILYTLKEIHKRGVIHRDIAPDNIIVTNEGVIKLIDFGAAKYAERVENENTAIVLKEGYAPIEQYGRKAVQGPYTDLYAVAALFYRMLTGAKPQPANDRTQEDKLLTLSEVGINIPEQAELAIMTCLNIQPQFRLQCAEDFMEALDGKNFVPVYEPEWILPKVKDDQDTVGNRLKQKFMAMAAWQRAAILAGSMAVCAGAVFAGVSVANRVINKNRGDNSGSNVEKMAAYQRGNTTWEEYKKNLDDAGCKAKVTYIYDKACKSEKVEDTEPRQGADIPDDKVVKVTVRSAGKVTIEKMTKMSKSEIETNLKNAGVTSDISFKYDYNSASKDKCFKQSKSGDVSSKDIDKLKFYISWGKKDKYMFKLPNLKDKNLDEAKSVIDKLNKKYKCKIKLTTKSQAISESVAKGDIISQEPKSGKKYNSNSKDKNIPKKEKVPKKVSIVVSLGAPTPTPAPTEPPAPAAPKPDSSKKTDKSKGKMNYNVASGGVSKKKTTGKKSDKKKSNKKSSTDEFVSDDSDFDF